MKTCLIVKINNKALQSNIVERVAVVKLVNNLQMGVRFGSTTKYKNGNLIAEKDIQLPMSLVLFTYLIMEEYYLTAKFFFYTEMGGWRWMRKP